MILPSASITGFGQQLVIPRNENTTNETHSFLERLYYHSMAQVSVELVGAFDQVCQSEHNKNSCRGEDIEIVLPMKVLRSHYQKGFQNVRGSD